MAERNENDGSNYKIIVMERPKPRYSEKLTEYQSEHMLLLIFKYLSVYDLLLRAGLVCKSWRRVARDRELWRRVDLTKQKKLKPIHLLKLLSLSNFRIIELHLPHGAGEGNLSAHEERLLILLLQKCQCLRVLHRCLRCWNREITDAVLEANSSLEVKSDYCRDHRPICYGHLRDHEGISDLWFGSYSTLYFCEPTNLSHGCMRRYLPLNSPRIESFFSDELVRRYLPLNFPRIESFFSDEWVSSLLTYENNIINTGEIVRERMIRSPVPELEVSEQAGNTSSYPHKENRWPAKRCPRQKHELRPPADIIKQTKMYNKPRKGQSKKSGNDNRHR